MPAISTGPLPTTVVIYAEPPTRGRKPSADEQKTLEALTRLLGGQQPVVGVASVGSFRYRAEEGLALGKGRVEFAGQTFEALHADGTKRRVVSLRAERVAGQLPPDCASKVNTKLGELAERMRGSVGAPVVIVQAFAVNQDHRHLRAGTQP